MGRNSPCQLPARPVDAGAKNYLALTAATAKAQNNRRTSRAVPASSFYKRSIGMKARLGIAPIAWWNDDLAEISSDISLEGCLCRGAPGRVHRAWRPGGGSRWTGRPRADPGGAWRQRLRRLVLRKAPRWRHRGGEGPHCRADGAFQGGRRALHRLRRNGAHDPGRSPRAARHPAPAQRGRDQGLWPQDDGIRRMVRRTGHADLLPPSHGGGDRDAKRTSTC